MRLIIRLYWDTDTGWPVSTSWPGREILTHWRGLVRDLRRHPSKIEITLTWER